MDRLAQIRVRLDAATPGPWVKSNDNEPTRVGGGGQHPPAYVPKRGPEYVLGHDAAGRAYLPKPADYDLIANAPADLAFLLDEVARLREVAKAASALRAAVRKHGSHLSAPEWATLDNALAAVAANKETT